MPADHPLFLLDLECQLPTPLLRGRKKLIMLWSHLLTVSCVKELVTFQCSFRFEFLATHVTQVGLLSAVTIHMSLEVTLAASGILTQRTFEGFHTYQRRGKYIHVYITKSHGHTQRHTLHMCVHVCAYPHRTKQCTCLSLDKPHTGLATLSSVLLCPTAKPCPPGSARTSPCAACSGLPKPRPLLPSQCPHVLKPP